MKNHWQFSVIRAEQRTRASRVLAGVLAVFVVMLAVSCGSKKSDAPGENIGGSSGAAGSRVCSPGDTRTCVGTSACSGGQACGVNGQWSKCDCGDSAGGTSGGGSGGGAGGSSAGTGGSGAGATSVGEGGEAGMAPSDPDPSNPNITHPTCKAGTCMDFPGQPILGDGVPPDAAALFGDPTKFSAGGLCALEPQLSADGKPGAMLPANWLRPRFRVMAPDGIDLLEIRIHSPVEKNDLVAYTTYKLGANGAPPSWYLPREIWAGAPSAIGPAAGSGLSNNAAGRPLTVTIRGINSSSPSKRVGIQGDFNIAPVVATGSVLFWTATSNQLTPDSSKLLGFAVGDEGVQSSLTVPQVKWSGEIGEDGAVLRGFYDAVKLPGFVDGQVRCIGCHTAIPDGSGVLFEDDYPWSKAGAELDTGAIPTGLAIGAQAIMKTPWWGQQTMSKAHWKDGDHLIVTSWGTTFRSGAARSLPWAKLPNYASMGGVDDKIKWHALAWINADYAAPIPVMVGTPNDYGSPNLAGRNTGVTAAQAAGGWGLIATGDVGVSDVSPALSHDGNSIVYVTTDYSPDGHPDATATTAQIRTVPFKTRGGGTSKPLVGASDANFLQYYPSYSADDKVIAFTQAPKPGPNSPDGPYYNRFGKVTVISAAGGTPVPLAANDPVACAADDVSIGVINSWPKWSPDAFTANGKTYYFLVFSSARMYADEFSEQFTLPADPLSTFKGLHQSSQLYLATVVVDNETGAVATYPAVYIWNQNRTPGSDETTSVDLHYSNLTPTWDPIALPPLTIPSAANVE